MKKREDMGGGGERIAVAAASTRPLGTKGRRRLAPGLPGSAAGLNCRATPAVAPMRISWSERAL